MSHLANLVCWLPTRAALGSLKGHPHSKSSLIKVGNQDKKIRAPRVEEIALCLIGQSYGLFIKGIRAMTTDEVLDALSRYTKDSMDSGRQTAMKLGIRPPDFRGLVER